MSSVVTKTSDDPELFDMTIVGSGHDIWDAADDFRYVWKEMPADGCFVIQARLDSFPRATSDWGKAALMVRANASQGSPHVQAAIRPGGADNHESQMQWRDNPDAGSGNQDPLIPANPLPYWIRGVYNNGQYSGYFAPDVDGQPGEWALRDGSPRALNTLGQDTILAGLAVTSHDDNAQQTAEWSNVQVFTPCAATVTLAADSDTTFPLDCDGESTLDLTATLGGCPIDEFTVSWAIDNGATIAADALKATATFTAPGSYRATVTVASDCGSVEAGVDITVGEPTGCGVLTIPGDVDLNGGLDISDPILQLNYLFAGDLLPACATEDDGTTLTPLGLLINDWDGSGGVNINDPTASLIYQFSGGPPHVLGEGCQLIEGEGCEDSCVQ